MPLDDNDAVVDVDVAEVRANANANFDDNDNDNKSYKNTRQFSSNEIVVGPIGLGPRLMSVHLCLSVLMLLALSCQLFNLSSAQTQERNVAWPLGTPEM